MNNNENYEFIIPITLLFPWWKIYNKKIYVGGGGIFSSATHIKEKNTINIFKVNWTSWELRSWEVHFYGMVH